MLCSLLRFEKKLDSTDVCLLRQQNLDFGHLSSPHTRILVLRPWDSVVSQCLIYQLRHDNMQSLVLAHWHH